MTSVIILKSKLQTDNNTSFVLWCLDWLGFILCVRFREAYRATRLIIEDDRSPPRKISTEVFLSFSTKMETDTEDQRQIILLSTPLILFRQRGPSLTIS